MGFWEDFKNVVREGFRLLANLTTFAAEKAKEVVVSYFRLVQRWLFWLFIAALAPLIVIAPCLMFGAPFGWLYGTYIVWLVILLAAGLLLITPVILIWRRVKILFPGIVQELEEWIDFIRTVVVTGFSFGIFVTLFPIWNSPGTFPLLLLVLVCWLTLPACAVSAFCRKMWPSVRSVQLLLLAALLTLQMAFPRHLERVKWYMAKIFVGPIDVPQKEITAQWRTLTWFNNAGEPQVWYSGSANVGYRLWDTPGFDRGSGERLKPVADAAAKSNIVADLEDRERIKSEREAKEKSAALRQSDEERRRQAAQEREELLARYVVPGQLRNTPERKEIAVLIEDENQNPNGVVGSALAAVLQAKSANASASFFTAQFIADGTFDKVFAGSAGVLDKMVLTNSADVLLLGRQKVRYSETEAVKGVVTVTASMMLELSVLSAQTSRSYQTHTATAIGAGFKNDDARVDAERKLIKQFTGPDFDGFWKAVLKE
jgi:hypothetical protein